MYNYQTGKKITISEGMSFPSKFLTIIDINGENVPRGRHIIKILEKEFSSNASEKIMKNKLNSLEISAFDTKDIKLEIIHKTLSIKSYK